MLRRPSPVPGPFDGPGHLRKSRPAADTGTFVGDGADRPPCRAVARGAWNDGMSSAPHPSPNDTTAGSAPAPRRAARERLGSVPAATAATSAVWLVAHIALHVALRASSGGSVTVVTLPAVVVVTLLVGLLAWGLLALLERTAPARARAVFLTVSAAVLLLSLLGPAGAPTGSAKAALACMHLAAALVLVPWLARTAGAGRRRS